MKPETKVFGASILFWYCVAAVVLATLSLTSEASDFSYFGEVGRTEYETPPNGLWHQKGGGYLTENDPQSTAFRLGAEYGALWIGARMSYFDLGKYGTDAFASTNEDCANNTGPHAYTVCGGRVSQYKTVGSMRGFGLSVIGRTPELFRTRLTLEAGFARVRQSFFLHVDHGETHSEKLRGPGRFAAVGLEHRNMTVSVQYYESRVGTRFNGDTFPSGVNHAYVAMVGARY